MNVTGLKLLSKVLPCLFLVLSLCQCDGKLIKGKGDAALDGAGDGELDRDGDSDSDAEAAGNADTDVETDGDGDGGGGSGGSGDCVDQYGQAPGFELCSETATTCTFNATTGGGTCGEMCSSLGGTCDAAFGNAVAGCDSSGQESCDVQRETEICECSLGAGGSGGIPGCSHCYFAENFESSTWANRYNPNLIGAVREQGEAARTGFWGIRMSVDKDTHWGGRILYAHPGGNLTEIWARYYVRFDDNWKRSGERGDLGAKAGYRARGAEDCRAPCLEMTDMQGFADNGAGDILGISYYHRYIGPDDEAARSYGHKDANWPSGSGPRVRERWYCVETYHRLNTPGQHDGIYRNYLDGELVSNQTSVPQRDENGANYKIDHSVLITYVGGSWVATQDMDVYYDDWAVSSQRIGCD